MASHSNVRREQEKGPMDCAGGRGACGWLYAVRHARHVEFYLNGAVLREKLMELFLTSLKTEVPNKQFAV
jgi:hypothetical protein